MLILFYITLVLLLFYGLLIEFYRRSWNRLPAFQPNTDAGLGKQVFVSVIIPARNEEKNIGACLESLLAQTYPAGRFEIIVVDDHSTDQTAAMVKAFHHPSITLLHLGDLLKDEKTNAYKKKSIESAIALSKGEWIMTTDADCILPPEWISLMVSFYMEKNAAFIAAPVQIPARSSVLSVFQSLDFITLQGITAATVHRRIHAMCNGANLGYQKRIFEEVGGFTGIDHIASGDDMLLMHKISRLYPDKIFFLKSRQAIVSTQPAESWKSFFRQRIRWASKTGKYKDRNIHPILFFVFLLNVSVLFFLFAGIAQPQMLVYFLILWLLKTIVEFPFVFSVAGFFNEQKLMPYFFLLQPLHMIYTVIAGAFGKFGTYEWKGRKVK